MRYRVAGQHKQRDGIDHNHGTGEREGWEIDDYYYEGPARRRHRRPLQLVDQGCWTLATTRLWPLRRQYGDLLDRAVPARLRLDR